MATDKITHYKTRNECIIMRYPMLVEIQLVIPDLNKNDDIRQSSGANMTSPGGKLTALACYMTKKVNKAE